MDWKPDFWVRPKVWYPAHRPACLASSSSTPHNLRGLR